MFTKLFKILFVILMVLAIFFGYAYFIEPDSLKTESVTFKLDCLKNKEELAGKKFVQISDLHFTGQTKEQKITQLEKEIEKINPAAVFITGDFISDLSGVEPAAEIVKRLAERYKTYIVFGNWDYSALDYNINILTKKFEDNGATVLVNDNMAISIGKETIDLLGVKDPYTSGSPKADLEKTMGKIETGDNNCKILLAHSPEIIPPAAAENIDLVLIGHTHGGQVYLPFITERMIPVGAAGKGYIRGAYRVGKTQIYINRGIGTSGWPLRFMASPEITEITLVAGK